MSRSRSVRRSSGLSSAEQAAVHELAATVGREVGQPPLSDDALVHLTAPDRVHLLLTGPNSELTGYAQSPPGGSAEVVGDPASLTVLLDTLESDAGDGPLLIWAHGRRSPVHDLAQLRGYRKHRELWQLRRPMGVAPGVEALPPGVTIRAFEPGRDERVWLEVNSAAFAHHPEQGGWQLADLLAREAEPWFDPAGFLLAVGSEGLLGYHWTKIHPDGVGEVYVLGVAPAAQGLRLGSVLLAAGLRQLADLGVRDVMLYVDGDNAAAMHLYERTGFTRHELDVQYAR